MKKKKDVTHCNTVLPVITSRGVEGMRILIAPLGPLWMFHFRFSQLKHYGQVLLGYIF